MLFWTIYDYLNQENPAPKSASYQTALHLFKRANSKEMSAKFWRYNSTVLLLVFIYIMIGTVLKVTGGNNVILVLIGGLLAGFGLVAVSVFLVQRVIDPALREGTDDLVEVMQADMKDYQAVSQRAKEKYKNSPTVVAQIDEIIALKERTTIDEFSIDDGSGPNRGTNNLKLAWSAGEEIDNAPLKLAVFRTKQPYDNIDDVVAEGTRLDTISRGDDWEFIDHDVHPKINHFYYAIAVQGDYPHYNCFHHQRAIHRTLYKENFEEFVHRKERTKVLEGRLSAVSGQSAKGSSVDENLKYLQDRVKQQAQKAKDFDQLDRAIAYFIDELAEEKELSDHEIKRLRRAMSRELENLRKEQYSNG